MKKSKSEVSMPLTNEQRHEYEHAKREARIEIEVGMRAFQRAGEWLLKIRDQRLYREEYLSWDAFCRDFLGNASDAYANRLIAGYVLCQDLITQGISRLPDSERVARQLAAYPKGDRRMIWSRALQIAGRKQPTRKMIQEAATQIVASKEVQKVWIGEFLMMLRDAKRKLTIGADFTGVSRESMEEVAALLTAIQRRISEIANHAGKRIDELNRSLPRGTKQ
jgi:hypothetical protein